MSFASRELPEARRAVSDLRELRALAHPLRLSLIDHLMSFGEQTAAQCAGAIGSTTSNCSYHLRALGRAGFVERVESSDGRERPWRAVATGLSFGPDRGNQSAAVVEAARALNELSLERDEELTRLARRRHNAQPEPWRSAEAFHEYALSITAAELAHLTEQIDELVRPFIGMTRGRAPTDAEVARLRLLAFRDPRQS